MTVPFNSVVGFNSTVHFHRNNGKHLLYGYHESGGLHIWMDEEFMQQSYFSNALQANYQHALQTARTSTVRSLHLTSSSVIGGLLSPKKRLKLGFYLLVENGDRVVTESSNTASRNTETSSSMDKSPAANIPMLESSNKADGIQPKASDGSGPRLVDGIQPKAPEGSGPRPAASANLEQEDLSANEKPVLKRLPLIAREKLRAARVLNRYTESKASKPSMGSKLLDALRESGKGKKRSGLPEAPTNLFDDSKRGLPKPGWTFEFPGGVDVFLIVVSFVLISTIMFATTYIVWKVGAIHFNEY